MSSKNTGFVPSGQLDSLESSVPQVGGLVVKKQPSSHTFKAPEPRASILGLDRLAQEKRRQMQEDEDVRKPYRSRRIDTPSDPGGVSADARDRLDAHRRDKDRYKCMFIQLIL